MHFNYFDIENFRGISHVRIPLDATPTGNVVAMVGLNESGKTTVLEAINYFSYKTDKLDALELPGYSIKDPHTLIPIGKRSNFNGTMKLEVGLTFSDAEEILIQNHLLEKVGFRLRHKIGNLVIRQFCEFKNSKYQPETSKTIWILRLSGTLKGQSVPRQAEGQVWTVATSFIKQFIPPILYFPNFLFEFPDRIYLEETGEDNEKHAFYRLVVQDILESLGNNTTLDTHILARAKSSDKNDRDHLQSLLLEMGRHVTSSVFGSWDKIFNRKVGNKKIIVSADVDGDGNHFLQFKLEDSDGFYLINERSLGFRWFFVFLLLTQYRGFRKSFASNPLFLLDEPASNLHPSAQSQLLETFRRLADKCRLIYTTHSHHMINPDWLESTFVIKNEGLDYQTDTEAFNSRLTSVTATKYRDFVKSHPDQTHYYKPILDVLSFAPSKLDMVPNVVMVEGKNDYYTLRYLQDIVFENLPTPKLLPGTGAGSLDSMIRLYMAWGQSFIVLLDSDYEGKKQQERYRSMFGRLVDTRIFTLEDAALPDSTSMENLFEPSERLEIQRLCYGADEQYNKTHFNRSIQELLLTRKGIALSDTTKSRFQLLLTFLSGRLAVADL